MTESRIEKFTRISQEMAAAVSEMRADAADVTTHAPETAALVEELSVTCDRWSQWEEVAAVVLAHLTAAGRLARAGGMTLTAEQWSHYQRMAADPRFAELSRDALGVMKWPENPLLPPALFPATEPADEERCDFYAETEQHGCLQCKRRDGHTAHHHIDPPAPGEPAEEETKAEALTDEQLLTLRSIAASSATSKPDGWAWRYWTEDIESLVKGGFIVRDDSFNPDQPRTYGHYRPTLFGEKQVATPTTAKEGEFIDIVFDGPPSHDSGRFVEVENPQGASISVGEWIDRGDGFWALRIPYTSSPVVPAPTETEFERGVRAGINEYRLYFLDENEGAIYQEVPVAELDRAAESAFALAVALDNTKRADTPAPNETEWATVEEIPIGAAFRPAGYTGPSYIVKTALGYRITPNGDHRLWNGAPVGTLAPFVAAVEG